MKRVLFLITDLAVGGAETQAVRLSIGLAKRGWRVAVVSMLEPEAFGNELSSAGVRVYSLRMKRGKPSISGMVRLIGVLREFRPNVLLCIMFHANLLGRIVGRLWCDAHIVSSIRTESFGGPARKLAMAITDAFGDVTTTNSSLVAERMVREHVVPRARVRVLRNAVLVSNAKNTNEDRATTRAAIGGGEFLWIAVGRLVAAKDYPTMLTAFRAVSVRQPCARLAIAGAGELEAELRECAAELGEDGRVLFLGHRKDIPAILAAADAYVLSSAWEGMPNAVIEAMAAGLPIVATKVGGVEELVEPAQNGYLVNAGNPAQLAEAMCALMDVSASERERMGRKGQRWVERTLNLESAISDFESIVAGLAPIAQTQTRSSSSRPIKREW